MRIRLFSGAHATPSGETFLEGAAEKGVNILTVWREEAGSRTKEPYAHILSHLFCRGTLVGRKAGPKPCPYAKAMLYDSTCLKGGDAQVLDIRPKNFRSLFTRGTYLFSFSTQSSDPA